MRNEEPANDAQDADFFYTDAIGNDGAKFIREQNSHRPFFLYAAFTAPHWPLHATERDLATHRGRFNEGWDILRSNRLKRQKELGLVSDPSVSLSERDPDVPSWDAAPSKAWQTSRMEAYAAMVHALDRNVGLLLQALDDTGMREDTIIMFLSDNGASYEEIPFEGPEVEYHRNRSENVPASTRSGAEITIGNNPAVPPGPENTYASYGRGWANLSNTPFRMFKEWVHEGGIATPFILSWDKHRDAEGTIDHVPLQLVDVLPTILELTGIDYPQSRGGRDIVPLQGTSFASTLQGMSPPEHTLFWEHLGNCAIRDSGWKLVKKFREPWELYDVVTDPTERINVAHANPDKVAELSRAWEVWAQRSNVKPFEKIIDSYVERGLTEEHAKGS